MIYLLFACVTAYILFSFLFLDRNFMRKLQRKEWACWRRIFSFLFTFFLLSIHGEPTKIEGGATWCSNSRMKDDG
jgi:EamA domain-containing membrane protein RarD